jgi:glutathione S-transferase
MLIFYASEYCPFCHATQLVLAEKHIDYDVRLVELANKAEFPHLLSPYQHVPVLRDGERRIYESSVINEYQEETNSQSRLMPADPGARAQVRFWIAFVHDRLVPAYFALMNSANSAEWPKLVDNFQRWLRFAEDRAFADSYFGHEHLTLADYALYPWFERLVSVTRYRGASIPLDCLRLKDWLMRMEGLGAVRECRKTEQQYITFFDKFYDAII